MSKATEYDLNVYPGSLPYLAMIICLEGQALKLICLLYQCQGKNVFLIVKITNFFVINSETNKLEYFFPPMIFSLV